MQNDIHLTELWDAIWTQRLRIVGVTCVVAAASVAYSLSLPNVYEATALLAPAKESGQGGMMLNSRLGGLASLAGFDLGLDSDNGVSTAVKVMASRKFGTTLIKKYNFLPDLMAVKSWDEKTRTIKYDPMTYDVASQSYIIPEESDEETVMWSAFKRFSGQLRIEYEVAEGFVSVTASHQSPEVAKKWVDIVVAEVNETMRLKVVEEAQKSLDYLNEKIQSIVLADMKTIFYQLVEEQTKTIMLAEVRDEYVFTTIDPAVISRERSSPNRTMICIVSTMLGGLLVSIWVILQYLAKKSTLSFE